MINTHLPDTNAPFAFAVTGAAGMLGTDLASELRRRGLAVVPLDRTACDVTSAESCYTAIAGSGANIVFNCAAYTDVNRAESEEDVAMAVNAAGADNVASACASAGARCIHVSTDYVFDGTKSGLYETDDAINPLNAYGRSKLAGERAVQSAMPAGSWTIVRTSWLYGQNGPNFVKTMLRLARDRKDLKIIDDQVGAPTYTVDLAAALVDLALAGGSGIVHATGSGACTWYDFAKEIFHLSGLEPASLVPCSSSEFPTPAVRPANSRLSPESLVKHGVKPLPSWQDALERYLNETGELRK